MMATPGGGSVGNFYVILPQVPKRDAVNTYRELNGVLLPRRYWPVVAGGDVATSVKVKWREDDHVTVHTLIDTDGRLDEIDDPVDNEKKWANAFKLHSKAAADQKFYYEPAAGAGVHWTFGTLKTNQIETASLSIWPAPDWALTDADAGVLKKDISPGRIVKGYTGTAGHASLGDLVQDIGGDSKEDYFNTDSIRPAFAWGHPVGVYSNSNTYKDLSIGAGSGPAYYYMRIPKLWTSQTTMECYPTALLTVSGAGEGDPAALRIKSDGGGDTWDLETETNTAGAVPDLYDYTDNSNETLTVNTGSDFLRVELKAPAGGDVHFAYVGSLVFSAWWNLGRWSWVCRNLQSMLLNRLPVFWNHPKRGPISELTKLTNGSAR